MAVLKGFTKRSIERKRYTLEYDCWLSEGEVLADFTIAITPTSVSNPLVADGAYSNPEHTGISTYLSGGNAGVAYTVTFIATTSMGQIKSDDIQIRVT